MRGDGNMLANTRLDGACFHPLVIHAADDEASFLSAPYVEELMLLSQLADAWERNSQDCRTTDLGAALSGNYGRIYADMLPWNRHNDCAIDGVTAAVVRERIQREGFYEEFYHGHGHELACAQPPRHSVSGASAGDEAHGNSHMNGAHSKSNSNCRHDDDNINKLKSCGATAGAGGSEQAHDSRAHSCNLARPSSSSGAASVPSGGCDMVSSCMMQDVGGGADTTAAPHPSWRFLLRVGLSRAVGLPTPCEQADEDDRALARIRVSSDATMHGSPPGSTSSQDCIDTRATRTNNNNNGTNATMDIHTVDKRGKITEGYLDVSSEDWRSVAMLEWFEDALTFVGMHDMTPKQARCVLIDAMCLLELLLHSAAAQARTEEALMRELMACMEQAAKMHTCSVSVPVHKTIPIKHSAIHAGSTNKHSNADGNNSSNSSNTHADDEEQKSSATGAARGRRVLSDTLSLSHNQQGRQASSQLSARTSSAQHSPSTAKSARGQRARAPRGRTSGSATSESAGAGTMSQSEPTQSEGATVTVEYASETEQCFTREESALVLRFLSSSIVRHWRVLCFVMHRTRPMIYRGCNNPDARTISRPMEMEEQEDTVNHTGHANLASSRASSSSCSGCVITMEDVQPFCLPPLSEFLPASVHTAEVPRSALLRASEIARSKLYDDDYGHAAQAIAELMSAEKAALMRAAAVTAQANRENKLRNVEDVTRVARAFERRIDRVVRDNVQLPTASATDEEALSATAGGRVSPLSLANHGADKPAARSAGSAGLRSARVPSAVARQTALLSKEKNSNSCDGDNNHDRTAKEGKAMREANTPRSQARGSRPSSKQSTAAAPGSDQPTAHVRHFRLDEIQRRLSAIEKAVMLPDIRRVSTSQKHSSMAKRGTM